MSTHSCCSSLVCWFWIPCSWEVVFSWLMKCFFSFTCQSCTVWLISDLLRFMVAKYLSSDLLWCLSHCLTFSEGLMTDKSYSSSSLFVTTNQSDLHFNVHHLPAWYLCSQKGMLLLLFSLFEIFVWAFMSVYRIGSRQENITIMNMFKAVEVWLNGNIVQSDEE